METYIALLRGVNIGGRHRLPMPGLTRILEELGGENVRTYIQSGNAVFRLAAESRMQIGSAVSDKILAGYGFAPKVLLLSLADLHLAVEHNPFPTGEGQALHFFFLESVPVAPDLERLAALKNASEEYKLHRDVFYLYAPDGVGRSRLAARVESCLGVAASARNWLTVSKLLELAAEGS